MTDIKIDHSIDNINVSVFSHYEKDGPRSNIEKPNPVFITFLIKIPGTEIWYMDGEEWRVKAASTDLLLTGCRLSDGVLRPPSAPGRFIGSFFGYTLLANGLDTPLARALYLCAVDVARYYAVPIAPIEDAMRPWVPHEKSLKNFKNVRDDIKETLTVIYETKPVD